MHIEKNPGRMQLKTQWLPLDAGMMVSFFFLFMHLVQLKKKKPQEVVFFPLYAFLCCSNGMYL